MEIMTNPIPAIFFPKKSDMLKKNPFKPVTIISNHFKIDIKNTHFNEYNVKIFLNEDIDKIHPGMKEPEEAIALDARDLRDHIFQFYRKKLTGILGPYV